MAQYAIRGYEVNAIDFIVKPVGHYVFVDKLKKAIRFTERSVEREIVIDTDEGVARLRISRISYIEKDKNYLVYHMGMDIYRVRGTMAYAGQCSEYRRSSGCQLSDDEILDHAKKLMLYHEL